MQQNCHEHAGAAQSSNLRSFNLLIDQMKQGSIRALARLITHVENREPGWQIAMQRIYPETGRACVVGITGSPGAGKSTLTNELARELRARSRSLGIIAVDPSSPFSGGAILGDRLRMRDIADDPEIFIRSMATRGVLGGLCQAARDVVRILDAFGKDMVLIETVGVGQDEIEVVRTADIVLVVSVPGQGDGIQAIKAGVMEIADIYVVNKADRPGAEEVVNDIAAMLELAAAPGEDPPPVLKTAALKREGIDTLVDAILHMADNGRRSRNPAKIIREEILTLLEREAFRLVRNRMESGNLLDEAVERIRKREADPYSVAETLMRDIMDH